MGTLLLAFLTLAVQDREEIRELKETLAELERSLADTRDDRKRERIQASIDKHRARLKYVKEGKVRDEDENEEEELKRLLKELDSRITSNPEDAGAHLEKAEVLMEMDRFKEALASAARAVKIAPGEPEAHVIYGMAALRLGKDKEAEKSFGRAIDLDPEAAEYVGDVLAEIAPGRMKMMMKRMMRGPEPVDMKKVAARLAANADDVGALVLRARRHVEKKNLEAAFDDLYRAIKLDPKHAPAYIQRAMTHAMTGRIDRAERDLVRAERIGSESQPGLRRAWQSLERLEREREERNRPGRDVDDQIESLKDRIEELEAVAGNGDLAAEERDRARAQIADARKEIERINEQRPSGEEEENPGDLERAWEKLESMEEELRGLAERYREAVDEKNRKKLATELRASVARFQEYDHAVQKLRLKDMRHEMEDLKFEIDDYQRQKGERVEEHFRDLTEEEE